MLLLEWRYPLTDVDGGVGENQISQIETDLKDDRRSSFHNETDSRLLTAICFPVGSRRVQRNFIAAPLAP